MRNFWDKRQWIRFWGDLATRISFTLFKEGNKCEKSLGTCQSTWWRHSATQSCALRKVCCRLLTSRCMVWSILVEVYTLLSAFWVFFVELENACIQYSSHLKGLMILFLAVSYAQHFCKDCVCVCTNECWQMEYEKVPCANWWFRFWIFVINATGGVKRCFVWNVCAFSVGISGQMRRCRVPTDVLDSKYL